MSDVDIEWKNIKTLYRYKSDRSEFGYELRIGCWIIDGRERDLMLAKQEFSETVSGQVRWGKAKGLGANDLYRIFEQAQSVSELMRFPLPSEFTPMK